MLLRLLCVSLAVALSAPADELYPEMSGFNPSGKPVGGPDPLAAFTCCHHVTISPGPMYILPRDQLSVWVRGHRIDDTVAEP